MDDVCRICANAADNQTFRCAEKMFGFGGEFIYFECGRCGCLQAQTVPADLSRYYPPHYYSFHLQAVPQRGFKARRYTERNPSKAGLVRQAKDWAWSSARFRDDYGRLVAPPCPERRF